MFLLLLFVLVSSKTCEHSFLFRNSRLRAEKFYLGDRTVIPNNTLTNIDTIFSTIETVYKDRNLLEPNHHINYFSPTYKDIYLITADTIDVEVIHTLLTPIGSISLLTAGSMDSFYRASTLIMNNLRRQFNITHICREDIAMHPYLLDRVVFTVGEEIANFYIISIN